MREIPGKKYRIFKAALLLGLAGCGFQTDEREKLQDLDYVITEEKELPGELREILEEKKVENKTNGLSIAGFVVSCCSMLIGLYGVTGLVGLILSAVGRLQAARDGGKTGLATAGIVLGIIGIIGTWIGLASIFG